MLMEFSKLPPIPNRVMAMTIFFITRATGVRHCRTPAFARAVWSGKLKTWSTSAPLRRSPASLSGQKTSIAAKSTPPAMSPPASDDNDNDNDNEQGAASPVKGRAHSRVHCQEGTSVSDCAQRRAQLGPSLRLPQPRGRGAGATIALLSRTNEDRH